MTTEEQHLVERLRAVDDELAHRAADTITRLVDERDAARNEAATFERLHSSALETAAEVDDALAVSEAKVAELQEALKPFAKAADVKLCGEWRDDERFGHTDITFHLTFGDLRAARRALEQSK